MSQIDVLEQIMLTIDEVKRCLAMNDLPVVHTNREQNSYVKKFIMITFVLMMIIRSLSMPLMILNLSVAQSLVILLCMLMMF